MVEASIRGVSSDGQGVVFKDAATQIHALKAGDTFLVKSAFAAKALAAETRGDQTVIMTNQAKLAELVRQGEINLDSPISFLGAKVSSLPHPSDTPFRLSDLIATPAYAQSPIVTADPKKNVAIQTTDMLISDWKTDAWSVAPVNNPVYGPRRTSSAWP